MNLLFSFTESFNSLKHNKFRTFLTTLGMFIGVASIISIISIGLMTRQSVMTEIDKLGSNMIFVSANYAAFQENHDWEFVKAEDYRILQEKFKDTTILPYFSTSQNIQVMGQVYNENIQSVGKHYNDEWERGIEAGRFFNPDDHDNKRKVIVLGCDAAAKYFGDEDPIGKTMCLDNIVYTVVGKLAPVNTHSFTDGIRDDEILVPFETLSLFSDLSHYGGVPVVHYLIFKVHDIKKMDYIESQLRAFFFSRYGLKDGKEKFRISIPRDGIKKINKVFNVITLVISLIAGISLLVSGIGIMNIMLVAISERTREIGIRKSIGAKPRDIMSQFLIESITICLLGGIVGVGLGILITWIVSAIMMLPFLISSASIFIGLGVSFAVGFTFGFFPAIQASKLDPIKALSQV